MVVTRKPAGIHNRCVGLTDVMRFKTFFMLNSTEHEISMLIKGKMVKKKDYLALQLPDVFQLLAFQHL